MYPVLIHLMLHLTLIQIFLNSSTISILYILFSFVDDKMGCDISMYLFDHIDSNVYFITFILFI